MPTSNVYVKTPKGINEITHRTAGLNQRARQALILIDGKRSNEEISAVIAGGGDEMMKTLVDDGFITLLSPATVGSKQSTLVSPPLDKEQRFKMAKNFMCNTINTFLGSMGSGLVSKLNKCNNLDELRELFEAWKEAIRLSGDGRKQATDLENKLAALLS